MTNATIALAELAEKGADVDMLRQMVQFPPQGCQGLLARLLAPISNCLRPNRGTMRFLNSGAVWLLLLSALATSTLIGVDLLQTGAPLLLVAAWFLLAPIAVLALMFCGLEKVGSLVIVLQLKVPADQGGKSCDLQRLRRPPRC